MATRIIRRGRAAMKHLPALVAAQLLPPDHEFGLWLEGSPHERAYLHGTATCLMTNIGASVVQQQVTAADVVAAGTDAGTTSLCACLGSLDVDITLPWDDYAALGWLTVSDPDRFRPRPLYGIVAWTQHRLGRLDMPNDPRLVPLVESRRAVLETRRAELVADPDYTRMRARRYWAGATVMADLGVWGYEAPHPQLVALFRGRPPGPGAAELVAAAGDIDAQVALAEQVTQAEIWAVGADAHEQGGDDSAWAWASHVTPRLHTDRPMLIRIPLAVACTVDRDSFTPLCLDDGYTAARVLEALTLADDPDRVPDILEALASAEL